MYCCILEMLRARHVRSASSWHVQLSTKGWGRLGSATFHCRLPNLSCTLLDLASSAHSGPELLMCSPCSLGACWASWSLIIWSIRGTGTQQQLWHRTHWQAPSRCQSKTDRCRCQNAEVPVRCLVCCWHAFCC